MSHPSKVEDPITLRPQDIWELTRAKDSLGHRIHAYPAKFPGSLAREIMDYAASRGINAATIADPCCGCGTVGLEATRDGISFIGIDINPVAVLIAKVKSESYQARRLQNYWTLVEIVLSGEAVQPDLDGLPERLTYWFSPENMHDLAKIRETIYMCVPKGKYRDFFLVAFSNILKACSRWYTKAIKPQVDPHKIAALPIAAFSKQVVMMLKANDEREKCTHKIKATTRIKCANILEATIKKPLVELLITSPPYAVSYEYADIHQLSLLWLRFGNDYRAFRRGSIGSLSGREPTEATDITNLPATARAIVEKLYSCDKPKAKRMALSVAKYFRDLGTMATQCFRLIKPGGMGAFVIGNTQYWGVNVLNDVVMRDALQSAGFTRIEHIQRKISQKLCTPNRNAVGRFSREASDLTIYQYESVIFAFK